MYPQGYFPDDYFTHHYWVKVGGQPVGGTAVAGRRYIMSQAMMDVAQERKLRVCWLQQQIARANLIAKIRQAEEEMLNNYYQRQTDAAVYSAMLAEV